MSERNKFNLRKVAIIYTAASRVILLIIVTERERERRNYIEIIFVDPHAMLAMLWHKSYFHWRGLCTLILSSRKH